MLIYNVGINNGCPGIFLILIQAHAQTYLTDIYLFLFK